MLISPHQKALQNRNIKMASRSVENVAEFKYFGTTATDQNFVPEEMVILATVEFRTFCLLFRCLKT
jgi:hypothetical protein